MAGSIDTDLSQQCQSVAGEQLDIGKHCDELLQDQNDLATHLKQCCIRRNCFCR